MSIPYHLRQNKAVDRSVFMDLLRRLSTTFKLDDYAYTGMGGPFLGDFKELHSVTGISDMHSIESEEWVFKRQQLNKPLSCIELYNTTSTEFIDEKMDELLDDKNVIIWLDYVTSMLGEQTEDIAKLSAKLGNGDILKITLNASSSQFNSIKEYRTVLDEINGCQSQRLNKEEILLERKNLLASKVHIPHDLIDSDLTDENYPVALIKILRETITNAINKQLIVQPLGFYVYRDGIRMLTASFIFLRKDFDLKEMLSKTSLNTWPLASLNWDFPPHKINMPIVSPIEKSHIDSHYPMKDDSDLPDLGFQLDEKESKHKKILKEYSKYYKYLPAFSKVEL